MEDNEQDYLMENSRIAIEDADLEEDGSRGSLSGVVRHVTDKYGTARRYRRTEEERWLRSWRNYRGIYNSNVKFTDAEKSRVFIKVTKTKVLAAYNQIVDVLFGNQRFPLSIDPTILPEGVEEAVHFDLKDVDSVKQEAGGAEKTERRVQGKQPPLRHFIPLCLLQKRCRRKFTTSLKKVMQHNIFAAQHLKWLCWVQVY